MAKRYLLSHYRGGQLEHQNVIKYAESRIGSDPVTKIPVYVRGHNLRVGDHTTAKIEDRVAILERIE